MAGIDLDILRKLRQALERPEEPLRALARVDCEVGARSITDEQRVAGENETLVDDEGAVLWTVARRVDHAHGYGTGLQNLAVLEWVERKLRLGERMHRDGDVVLEGEPPVP